MPTYTVDVLFEFSDSIAVEAADEWEARDKAEALLAKEWVVHHKSGGAPLMWDSVSAYEAELED